MGIVYYSCFIKFISKLYRAAGRRVNWGHERLQNSSAVKPVLDLVTALPEIYSPYSFLGKLCKFLDPFESIHHS